MDLTWIPLLASLILLLIVVVILRVDMDIEEAKSDARSADGAARYNRGLIQKLEQKVRELENERHPLI